MDTDDTTTSALPAARQVLTSLMDAISTIPLDEDVRAPDHDDSRAPSPPHRSQNALGLVPLDRRHLLVTLHVLFPALVLPALHLLDNGLVARVVLACDDDDDDDDDDDAAAAAAASLPPRRNHNGHANVAARSFFTVRSGQTVRGPRRRRGHGASGRRDPDAERAPASYVVRLDAWNCTCAAFAFSAFAGPVRSSQEGGHKHQGKGKEALPAERGPARGEEEWSFGGLSLDGTDEAGHGAEGVPLCKHLLACLLADRWKPALGSYVMDRSVRKQEMAGIVADV